MKIKNIEKLVKCGKISAWLGVILVPFELGYVTYLIAINNIFSNPNLFFFVIPIYGYMIGGLALMVWFIKNIDLWGQEVINKQLQKGGNGTNG